MDRFGPDFVPSQIKSLAARGARIGLLGGSFNPAHAAHLHISLIALRRLRLDAVWWLVSPQNPMKPTSGMAPLARRLEQARKIARHPGIHVSSVEAALNTNYSVDTVRALQSRFFKARFVWLMGGDSLANFHFWRRWQDILHHIPVAVVARPGFTIAALASPAAVRFRAAQVHDGALFSMLAPPAWIFLQEQLDPMSATTIRRHGGWP